MASVGLSFPIRLSGRGGLRLSTTALNNERMEEIINLMIETKHYERLMYPNLGSDIDTQLFDTGDVSIQSLIQYEIATLLAEDIRIKISPSDISFDVEDNVTYITISCIVQGERQDYKVPIQDGR